MKAIAWLLLYSIFAALATNALALHLTLHPLSTQQVYRLLARTGRSAAIPEGRIITRGLTYIGNLTRRLIGGRNQVRVTSQEVCFETRSARNLREAEQVYESYVLASNRRKHEALLRNSDSSGISKSKARKKFRDAVKVNSRKRLKIDDAAIVNLPDLSSRFGAADVAYDDAVSSVQVNSEDKANPDTAVNRQLSDALISTFTTSTTPEGAINCIVIRKNE